MICSYLAASVSQGQFTADQGLYLLWSESPSNTEMNYIILYIIFYIYIKIWLMVQKIGCHMNVMEV